MNLNKKFFILALLVLCFLVLRLSILLTDVKQIEMNEETVCGVLANDVFNKHLRLPLLDYQSVPWCGDTLIAGLLAIPFFLIFGNSIISLKLIPLCFSLGTFILWYLFLNKYISRTTAILTGLLLIVSPPYYTRLSLIAAIPHTELNFFSIAVMFIFLKLINQLQESKKGNPENSSLTLLILLGILSGIAIYFHYLFCITLLACLLLWYAVDKRFILRKHFFKFTLFFLIGLIPWIASAIYHYPESIRVLVGPHSHQFLFAAHLKKLLLLLVYNIPHSLGFDHIGAGGIELSMFYYIIFLLCFVLSLLHYRYSILSFLKSLLPARKLEIESTTTTAILLILSFPLLFFLIFTISGFDIPPIIFGFEQVYDFSRAPFKIYRYRYLAPLYPFMCVIISLCLGEIGLKSSRSFYRYCSGGIIVCLLTLGLYSNYQLISWDKFGKGFIYKGYRQWEYARDITRQDWGFKKIVASVDELEGESRSRGLRILGERMANEYRDNISHAIKKIEEVSPVYHHSLYFGLSSRLTEIYRKDQKKVIRLINEVPNQSKPFCFEGYGFAFGYRFLKGKWNAYDYVQSLSATEKFLYKKLAKRWKEPRWDISQYINSINEVEEKYRPFCYIGLGRFLAREEAKLNIARCISTINKVDEKFKIFCYIGFGQEMGELFNNFNMNLFPFGQIPKKYQKFFFEEIDLKLNTFCYYSDKIGEHFRPYVYEGLGLAIRKNIEDEVAIDYLSGKIDSHYKNNFLKGLKGISSPDRGTGIQELL